MRNVLSDRAQRSKTKGCKIQDSQTVSNVDTWKIIAATRHIGSEQRDRQISGDVAIYTSRRYGRMMVAMIHISGLFYNLVSIKLRRVVSSWFVQQMFGLVFGQPYEVMRSTS